MLAKAVAHHTSASFIAVVGSEFVQVRRTVVLCFDVLDLTNAFFFKTKRNTLGRVHEWFEMCSD